MTIYTKPNPISSAARGWVYAAINPSMPGLIKIGCSVNHPFHRLRQLSASTSAPSPFILAYHKFVEKPFQVEAKLHETLDAFRVNDSREFFQMEIKDAIDHIDHYDALPEDYREDLSAEYPFAWLFSSFPDDGSDRFLTPVEQDLCRELEKRVASGKSVY